MSPANHSGVAPARARKATDAEVLEWAKRHDLDCWDDLMQARQAFEDAESHHLTRGVKASAPTLRHNEHLCADCTTESACRNRLDVPRPCWAAPGVPASDSKTKP
jgi:hypothetical protein